MQIIKGHKSWSLIEIIGKLTRNGHFTCCTLPHYRFRNVQERCHRLLTSGLIVRTGQTDISANFKPTPLLREYVADMADSRTRLPLNQWLKRQKKLADLLA